MNLPKCVVYVVVLLTGFMTCTSIYAAENKKDSYDYRTSCPESGGLTIADKWGFYKCECVSYVADKLNERGVKFNNA